ncbi:MAG: GNAT family N-acetyltransferase [Eubacterium sp.]|nr:GNAT family N-acetyltransferase [Eubacterium sp.]
MRVISFYDSERQEHWLNEIKRSDWSASAFLYKLLSENIFFKTLGEGSRVLLLTEGDELISHCTFSEYDDIQPTELTPWAGFVYTFPEHRGHRYAGLLFHEIERLAKERNIPEIYLSSNHKGLYEKYGFEYKTQLVDIYGEPTGVFIKRIKQTLETERLVLRRWKDDDAEDLYLYAKDPEVGLPAGWPPHKDVEHSLNVIRSVFNGAEAYAVCLKKDNKPIGAIELMYNLRESDNAGECELGFWLAKPFWGRGIIPEAGREMLRRAFVDLGMKKVWCGYYDGNEKSKRVQQKLGFRFVRTKKNVPVVLLNETRTEKINCITREEWENMITVEVKYIMKPGQRDNFYNAIISQGIDRAAKDENGNLRYDFEIPENEEDILYLHELWRDGEALDAHARMPHYKALGRLKAEYVKETIIKKE